MKLFQEYEVLQEKLNQVEKQIQECATFVFFIL
jgi:hypothetical protein